MSKAKPKVKKSNPPNSKKAKLKKAKALYLMRDPESSAIARKMAWDASDEGQLLIQREAELRGLPDEIDGLMSRIYSAIR